MQAPQQSNPAFRCPYLILTVLVGWMGGRPMGVGRSVRMLLAAVNKQHVRQYAAVLSPPHWSRACLRPLSLTLAPTPIQVLSLAQGEG